MSVRRFVVRALNDVPGLALDEISIRRENAGSASIEARVQFTLFYSL